MHDLALVSPFSPPSTLMMAARLGPRSRSAVARVQRQQHAKGLEGRERVRKADAPGLRVGAAL